MLSTEAPSELAVVAVPVVVAADVQDALLMVLHDLQRLQGLLGHATDNLLECFDEVNVRLDDQAAYGAALAEARKSLHMAVTELQFHDLSTQLIAHIAQTLQGCASQLALATMGEDEGDGDAGAAVRIPERPNPVTQAEMDAGSVELF